MGGFKETISKAIGNSEIFNKTADFISDKQKKFKADKALEDANLKLTALYLELGKTSYKRRPLTAGRTSTVIRAEIDAQLIVVANCQALVDELNAPKPEPETEEPAAPTEPETPEAEATPSEEDKTTEE
ncbi:MAG: hypothetical protein IKL08_05310 [Clostridia bacterium]|nr:hypothetical protein [Clostridia bacterium]